MRHIDPIPTARHSASPAHGQIRPNQPALPGASNALLALVRCLARQAAAEDWRAHLDAIPLKPSEI